MNAQADGDAQVGKSKPFGPIHTVEPTSQHTHTVVFLHGRGSYGKEFAEELFDESRLSDQTTLAQRFPGWRWLFPSSQQLWSTTFQEEMPAWFEAHSLTDITVRQDLQMDGIAESVRHVTAILDEEIRKLDGIPERVILGGMSQGGAIAMWTLLCHPLVGVAGHGARLGAFVGTSTWLPFASNIERFSGEAGIEEGASSANKREADKFIESMMGAPNNLELRGQCISTSVFLGHGADDAVVDFELGRQAKDVLERLGLQVDWKEYTGAELEGHWLKVPEEVDDVAEFLGRVTG